MSDLQEILNRAKDVRSDPSSPIPYDVYEILSDLIWELETILERGRWEDE